MSARITLHCDRESQYGLCTSQLYTEALTLDQARAAGGQLGWLSHSDGNDYCPTCSGAPQPRRTNVVHLAPKDQP
ncbi:hypothetical protein RVR_8283 [Actinacidiphila reveromycinica]|uniref:Uncharacterized protein n=1 Tax=Actinacidiphila reveromycinica TaxID=659352 RepID=A0A7U3UY86_9ACTN|nr:hypothetical protein [Streptomyces sp. SN-593]BBB01049.1 hypothetical protein RVR_8283 [Streptomyces sp. SN-593]